MKILEYGYYDHAANDREVKETVRSALELGPNLISVLPSYARIAKTVIKNSSLLSSVIDYPFGLSCLDARLKDVKKAIDNGCDVIEIMAPNHALCNRKYDHLRKDINQIKDLCDRHNTILRYTLDYRTYTSYLIHKAARIFLAHNIDAIYPSNNLMLDNIVDNIIVCMSIVKDIPINVVTNGNAWTDQHIDLIINNPKIYAYKTNNLHTLEKIVYKTSSMQHS